MTSTETAGVMLVVPGARAARVLLQTDVLPSLLEAHLRVVILTPRKLVEELRHEHAGAGIRVEPARLDECERYHRFGLRGFCGLVRSCSGNGRLDLSTLDNRLHATLGRLEARRPLQAVLLALAVKALRRSARLRRLWLAFETRFFVKHLHADTFAAHRPDLVVLATPGYDSPLETEVLREARSLGIATAIVVRGWDNPTAKGMMAAVPDHVLAWTDIMKRELVEHHDVPASSIIVTGAPYLDFYSARTPVPPREAYLRGMGLDPSRRTILFATKPPASYSSNLDIMTSLAEAVRDGRVPVPSQLIVRLYPLDRTSSAEAEELAECRRLAALYPNVVLSVPEGRVTGPEPRESAAEAGALRAMLTHADVIVNVFSTMAIEAAMHDLPIVTVGYNGSEARPEPGEATSRSVHQHARENHNRRLVSHVGTIVVRSEAELIRAVGDYLTDRSRDAEGRRRIVAHEAGPNHGTAGRAVGRALAGFVTGDADAGIPEALAS